MSPPPVALLSWCVFPPPHRAYLPTSFEKLKLLVRKLKSTANRKRWHEEPTPAVSARSISP